jgi:tetratricopeptide (TPR) repeat protein
MSRFFLFFSLLFTLSLSQPLFAQNSTEEAKKLFKDGEKEYKKNNYSKAVQLWKSAYEKKPLPLLLYNIAQATEKQGNAEEAIAYYEQYLATNPTDAGVRKSVEESLAALKKKVRSTKLLKISQENALLSIDDGPPMKPPTELSLTLGTHRLLVQKEGFADKNFTVDFTTNNNDPIEVILEPLQFVISLSNLPKRSVIFVDGTLVTGPELSISYGTHTLSIQAPGYKPYNVSLDVKTNDSLTLALEREDKKPFNLPVSPAVLGASALSAGSFTVGLLFSRQAALQFALLEAQPELRTEENISRGEAAVRNANIFYVLSLLSAGGAAVLHTKPAVLFGVLPHSQGAMAVFTFVQP